jgi:hypothetical protein
MGQPLEIASLQQDMTRYIYFLLYRKEGGCECMWIKMVSLVSYKHGLFAA